MVPRESSLEAGSAAVPGPGYARRRWRGDQVHRLQAPARAADPAGRPATAGAHGLRPLRRHDAGRPGAPHAGARRPLERRRDVLGGARSRLHRRRRTRRPAAARLPAGRARAPPGRGRLLHGDLLPPRPVRAAAQRPAHRRDPRRDRAGRAAAARAGHRAHLAARGGRPGGQHAGLQMAYLKRWAPRSYSALELRLPHDVEGPAGSVSRLDACKLAASLDVDLVYVDPPYNQHSYFSNYHVWETLVRWDAPESYGVANKRLDCREQKSRVQPRSATRAARAAQLFGAPAGAVAARLGQRRGLPRPRSAAGAARRARSRRPDRRRGQPLRRGPDRHPQPGRREGRERVASAQPRAPVPGRARPRARRVGGRRGVARAERPADTAVSRRSSAAAPRLRSRAAAGAVRRAGPPSASPRPRSAGTPTEARRVPSRRGTRRRSPPPPTGRGRGSTGARPRRRRRPPASASSAGCAPIASASAPATALGGCCR